MDSVSITAHPVHMPRSRDAALVMGLAGTAMAFAHSADDEVERWLRALRLHGQVGRVMQAIGVSEGALVEIEELPDDSPAPLGDQALAEIDERAERVAAERGAESVGTPDVLEAVGEVYGELFDRTLYVHGSSRDEVAERVAASPS
jgi:hypothetical protein